MIARQSARFIDAGEHTTSRPLVSSSTPRQAGGRNRRSVARGPGGEPCRQPFRVNDHCPRRVGRVKTSDDSALGGTSQEGNTMSRTVVALALSCVMASAVLAKDLCIQLNNSSIAGSALVLKKLK